MKKIPSPAVETPKHETSHEVSSNQSGVHRNLKTVVEKHLKAPWRKPINDFSHESFGAIRDWLLQDNRTFILDSACGTGESSVALARQFPGCRILGFDRSAVRIDKLINKTEVPDNCMTIRADADDLWRQLLDANLKPARHFLFYPNPYPKSAQLNRRWHGSPAFPYLIALGGQIELRSNWKIYVEEFAQALLIATGIAASIAKYEPKTPISPFEAKYHCSGHRLWQLTAHLPRANSDH